ncbi:MAG: methyltransferase domain-containing protein [Methanobacteriota archaeon]
MHGDDRRLLVSLKDFKTHLVTTTGDHVKVAGLGILDPRQLAGLADGAIFEFCGETYVVLREAGLADILTLCERRAQIITLKDTGPIVARLGIRPEARVVEIGAGSGYMTLALASFVGKDGHVTTHEIEPKSIELVRKNLERAGLSERVSLVEGDAAKSRGKEDSDALVADVPNPWDMLEFAESSLRPGASAAFYTPSANQVERLVRQLRARGWAQDVTIETLERQMVVGDMGIRPSFDMLGHTGYLTFARWLGRAAAERLANKQ